MARGDPAAVGSTRQTILRAAAARSSVEGLEGLTIGQLASEIGMSKSGLFAHFGSKEELQLATVEEARERYVDEVVVPGLAADAGINRVASLCGAFLSYVERGVFPGGCFFAGAMAEFGARGPGPVRDRIAQCQEQWMTTLERAVAGAIAAREMKASTDPAQLAFELEAVLLAGNWYFHLFGDRSHLERSSRAVRSLIIAAATPRGTRMISGMT